MLVVSRESAALGPFWSVSQSNSWQLEIASTGLEALERLQSGIRPDLIFVDLVPGDADSMHVLGWLRKMRPELKVILLSESADNQQLVEAERFGAHDSLVKPCQDQQLEELLNRHLTMRNSSHDAELACDEIEQISEELFFAAVSPTIRKLRARAELLAQVNAPVLIVGESGSGKEVVARLIHKLSARSASRILKVNCATLPNELLDSELFGREHEASGEKRTKRGKFELCHRGTILLDEITEMPASLQAKLLHVLEDSQFFRLGGETTTEIDVRILAATNVDVERAVAEKKLREDLYYRLSAFTIHVPPLRQRKDEIPLLLAHFMNRISKHYGLPPRMLSPAVLEGCQHHSWPGNLRELENFVKRYLVMGDESLAASELEPEANFSSGQKNALSQGDSAGELTAAEFPSLKSLVRTAKGQTERSAIADALQRTQWNRKAAARLLGISYRALLYKVQDYHMTPPATYASHPAPHLGIKGNGQGES
jgi:two-component system, NtrC family, response regulator AtoC